MSVYLNEIKVNNNVYETHTKYYIVQIDDFTIRISYV